MASPELPGTPGWDWVKVDHEWFHIIDRNHFEKKFFLQSLKNVQSLKLYLSPYVWFPLQTSRANNQYAGTQDMSHQCLPPTLCFPTAPHAWGSWATLPGVITVPSCLPSSLLPGVCPHQGSHFQL